MPDRLAVAGILLAAEMSIPEAEYVAAYCEAVAYNSDALGRFRLTGADRCDFMHRMSTNNFRGLQPGQSVATILITKNARIIDRVMVYVRDTDLLLLTSAGAQKTVSNWLGQHIFFNDDVQIHDLSDEWGIFSLYGASAGNIVTQVIGEDVKGLELHAWGQSVDNVFFTHTDPIAGDGFHILADTEKLTRLWQAAIEAGATPISEQTMDLLRIEAGLPHYGTELCQNYIPLEVGLRADINFNKGCYIGQEIIARMESRQRLAKKMIKLRSNKPIQLGAKIRFDDSPVGRVTSAAVRPDGEAVALGFIKPLYAIAGNTVAICTSSPGAEFEEQVQSAVVLYPDVPITEDCVDQFNVVTS